MKKCEYCSEEHKNENTGCRNSGNRNSGYYNSGNRNSGYYNSGNYNSGNYNSGDYNSGDRNSGYRNSGYRNSGDCNSGNYNSGNYNSGWFNTDEPKMRMFNKETNFTYSEFINKNIIYPDLKICAWIENNELPKEEQTDITAQMGGKLKTLDYKEAWKEYWNRASEDDKKWFMDLPNFSWEIFTSITGIEQEQKDDSEIIELNGKKYKRIK